jgi:CDGSH-type Zn-finger protein/mannose-6-phosphate isomerase-like protein (cupin superfamily)
MLEPKMASRKGFCVKVTEGKSYLWCSCGLSAKQPYCDGSHQGTQFLPVKYKAPRSEDVLFCGCKHTRQGPMCDGTHNNLPGGYQSDDPDSAENQQIKLVKADAAGKTRLDNDCYVLSTSRAALTKRGTMAFCPIIGPALGALYQSQFYAEYETGASPVIAADGKHILVFVGEGDGEIEISGHMFEFTRRSGIYVRPGEAFRIHNDSGKLIKLYISVAPGVDNLSWRDDMPAGFEAEFPDRVEEVDPTQRHAMAARFYQLLINKAHGSTVATQFIGNIPPSKAEPHRHLYEEALIFLTGEGIVWTKASKTPVGPGDVLFLPAKQVHSVQCLGDKGMDVVGVIYPGDNPSINY